MSLRGRAAVGDGWHVGIVAEAGGVVDAVVAVFGIGAGRDGFRTGRMSVPGGVTYLVVAPPGSLAVLRDRYDPAVVVLVGDGPGDVVLTHQADGPVGAAVATFFRATGEPASLPGFAGAPAFRVLRAGGEAPFPADTTRLGRTRAWVVVRGVPGEAAQTLRYLIPYLRPHL
jgi:hypothetical protein